MAVLNFDANTVAPDTGGFEALPAGWYKVMMESSEMKPTKDNTGSYLECKYKILDGAHSGKGVFGRLNLRNANAQAQEIAYKQLSAICHATGVLQVADSAQLHNIPLQIKLKLREARKELDAQGNVLKEYEASNEIGAYKNINEQVGAPAVGGFPAPSAPPAFAPPPAPPSFAPPMQQQAPQFAPPPMQAPQYTQAPPQFAPAPVAPAAPAAPQWQAPAAQQPWQAPQQAPAAAPQAPQFAPAPVQQAPVQQPQAPQQYAPAPAPAVNPAVAQAATPPWMQPQAPQA